MAKLHSSLSPVTNILLILVWAVGVAILLFIVEPPSPSILVVIGAILGAVGGTMQHLSLKEATNGFATASSLLEVRGEFEKTLWGTRYLRFLYFSKLILVVLAFVDVRQPLISVILGYLASYLSLMFVRDVITLRDTFFLQKLSSVVDQ